jgi:hypothetical protein
MGISMSTNCQESWKPFSIFSEQDLIDGIATLETAGIRQ